MTTMLVALVTFVLSSIAQLFGLGYALVLWVLSNIYAVFLLLL